MKRTLLLILLILSLQASAQNKLAAQRDRWVDSVMATFSIDDKAAQVLVVRAPFQNAKPKDVKAFEKLLKENKIGGICFFKGTCATQLERTRRYQRLAPFPLMVTIDGEWGLGMRLTDAYSFPYMMMMGALNKQNDSLITAMGREVARQCQMMGIHVDYAPDADLNSNPLNPVIGARSFGEDKVRVADKAILYAKALQQGGVLAVGKHFPGHGDTETDSHVSLPVITHPRAYIDSIDLYPFRRMVKAGVRGMMVGHLQVKALDMEPSSTSDRIVNQLLRKELGFKGLIFTDGMEMGGITKCYTGGEAELRALLAGCDVVLLPNDVEATLRLIRKRAKEDSSFALLLDQKCRNILREKYRLGVHHQDLAALHTPTREDNERCRQLTERIALKAFTLVRNEGNVLPFKAQERVVSFALGNCDTAITAVTDQVAQRLAQADKVVLHLHARLTLTKGMNYGFTSADQDLVRQIVAFNPQTVLVVYGSPYVLRFLPQGKGASPQLPAAIVVAYQDMEEVHAVVNQVLWGQARFEGVLPVTAGDYRLGTSLALAKAKADPYKVVREMGMKEDCFRKMDSIALMGIEKKAYPGCQILVAYKGRVVYHRGYGRQTYDPTSQEVDTNTVYDLASLTKVCATTLAVMRLVDLGKVKLDDPVSRYVPYLKHTNKKKITIRECLSHCARLKAFDAYYKQVPPDGSEASREQILRQIADSPLNKKEGYVYSDLGFILLADMVRYVSGQPIDLFAAQQFYQPMGLTSTTFMPRLNGLDTNRIAPTEQDTYWRHRLLRGEVQDQNAWAMGGVAGHAGLFSRASDLNRLCQMLLYDGRFQGKQYLSKEVVSVFNTRHYATKGNRRALGFDKPLIHGRSSHCAPEASQLSFGHTGYTGTMLWVDPQKELVYIFLSNRVHPSCEPNLLSKLNIRTDIQSLIYQSIIGNSR